MGAPATLYVTSTDPFELRPPVKGRKSLTVFNPSVASVYYIEGTIGGGNEDRVEIPAGQGAIFSEDSGDVPQGTIWLFGDAAARQRVQVRQT